MELHNNTNSYDIDDSDSNIDSVITPLENKINSDIPFTDRMKAFRELVPYMEKLILIPFKEFKSPVDGYFPSSSSIVRIPEGYLVNVRLVGYWITEDGRYVSNHPRIQYITKNNIKILNHDFEEISSKLLEDESGTKKYDRLAKGIEDIRLVQPLNPEDDIRIFCNNMELSKDGFPITYASINRHEGIIRKFKNFNPFKTSCEKNWLPYYDGKEFCVVYGWHPLRILSFGEKDPYDTEPEIKLIKDIGFNDYRGSAGPIEYKNGWLVIIHQVLFTEDSMVRKYFHRLLWFTKEWDGMKCSRYWYFEKDQVEYTVGMIDNLKDGIWILYSIKDNSSKMGCLLYDLVDAMLELE